MPFAAEMLAFEVNGKCMSVHNGICGSMTLHGEGNCGASNNLVQELRLDDARFHTTSCCFCCYGND